MNALEWALNVLRENSGAVIKNHPDCWERMTQLQALADSGMTDNGYTCRVKGCPVVGLPVPGKAPIGTPCCPEHGPMVEMTWKAFALGLMEAGREAHQEIRGKTVELMEALERFDTLRFREANEEDELNQLRELTSGHIGRFAGRMDRWIRENSVPGVVEWENRKPEYPYAVQMLKDHTKRLEKPGNQGHISANAIAIAVLMMKLHELYGSPS